MRRWRSLRNRTAFLLESEVGGPDGRGISTGGEKDGWMVEVEPGQRPLGRETVTVQDYMAAGPGEQLDAAKYDWGWQDAGARWGELGGGGFADAGQYLWGGEPGALGG